MRLLSVLLGGILFFAAIAHADDDTAWKSRFNEQGITIHTRKVEGAQILEFKSATVVNAPIAKVVALFEDPKRISEWYYQSRLMEQVEEKGADDKIFYFVIALPWPVATRDSVFRRVRTTDPQTGIVTYVLSAIPDRLPRVKGKVRIPYLKGTWRFTPTPDGKTDVYFQQHSDAGGSLPPFLANALVVDIPLNSLKKFKALVESEMVTPIK